MSGAVQGYCPMGCGRTLFLGSDGYVTCSLDKCPNPTAVADILADNETEHIVEFEETTFRVQHPLRERLHGDLFTCKVHEHVASLDGPPVLVGRYRATTDAPGKFVWSRLP